VTGVTDFANGPVSTHPPPLPAGTITPAAPKRPPACLIDCPFPPMLWASPLKIGEVVGSAYFPQFQYLRS
jgi:hypothetical protein